MRAEQVKAFGNQVFLRVNDRRAKVGHIHLPGEQTGVEKVGYSTARVLSVGPGILQTNSDTGEETLPQPRDHLAPGDTVIIRDYHREFMKVDVEESGIHCLIHFNDIVAVCEEGTRVGAWSDITDAS